MHPFDAKGVRRHYSDIPRSITELVDDPFRSLAGELRRAGGFAKDTTPFSEFIWADFLRRRMKRKAVERDFERAIAGRCNWPKARMRIISPAGAARRRRIDGRDRAVGRSPQSCGEVPLNRGVSRNNTPNEVHRHMNVSDSSSCIICFVFFNSIFAS